MSLENIVHSEISQRKTNTIWFHLNVDLKDNINEYMYKTNRFPDKGEKKNCGYQRGEGRWEEQIRGMGLIDTLYIK